MKIAAAAPALAHALEPKTNGSSPRASLHTGIAVFASSAPVYVASGGPVANQPSSASRFSGRRMPIASRAAAPPPVTPETTSTQLPTLIGEVTLNTRSMFRNRSGRPRSEIRRIGDTISIAAPTRSVARARSSFRVRRANPCSTAQPPAMPPVKR